MASLPCAPTRFPQFPHLCKSTRCHCCLHVSTPNLMPSVSSPKGLKAKKNKYRLAVLAFTASARRLGKQVVLVWLRQTSSLIPNSAPDRRKMTNSVTSKLLAYKLLYLFTACAWHPCHALQQGFISLLTEVTPPDALGVLTEGLEGKEPQISPCRLNF